MSEKIIARPAPAGPAGEARNGQPASVDRAPSIARAFVASRIELAVLAIAFAIQVPLILNSDLGWLLTVAERMLAGQRLGIDVIELNPPLSVLIYLPAAWMATILPIPAHLFVALHVLLLILVASVLSARLLRPVHPEREAQRRARIVILAVLALAPGYNFGQRDHIATVAMVPFVALAASLCANPATLPPMAMRILAGIGAGFAMAIKPHFALVAGLPLLSNAWRQRSLRPLFGPETWTASAVVLGYGLLIFTSFDYFSPAYAHDIATLYAGFRVPLWIFALEGSTWTALIGIALLIRNTRGAEPEGWTGGMPWLLAALGGLLSYVVQGKGFGYTRIAAGEFALLAGLLAPVVLDGRKSAGLAPGKRVVMAALCLPAVMWMAHPSETFAELEAPVLAHAPARPKLLAITDNVGVAEPLARKIGGEYVSAAGSLLQTGLALHLREQDAMTPEQDALTRKVIATERQRLRHDLAVRKPDVLLVDQRRFALPFNWLKWARMDPVVDREFAEHYDYLKTVRHVEIWIRSKP